MVVKNGSYDPKAVFKEGRGPRLYFPNFTFAAILLKIKITNFYV